jgi:hypothetical protein
MPRVIISSGHTQSNPGVTANGLQEYEVARKIAKFALKYIRLNGLISLSTPPNLDLSQRIEWINRTGYMETTNDIAIEVHINDGGKRGVEGWYKGDGQNQSQHLVDNVVQSICAETGLPNQGSQSEFTHELGSISFIHEINPIGCIIECGYIDNDEDAKFLKEDKNLEILGKGVAKGVLKYFELEYREFPVPGTQITQQPAASMAGQGYAQAPAQYQQAPVAPAVPAPQTGFNNDDLDDDLDDYDDFSLPAAAPVTPAPSAQIPGRSTAPMVPPAYPTYQQPANPAGSLASYSSYAPPAPMPPQGQAQQGYSALPSREERKQMITRNYIKILGRDPNQNDLNYFLNIGIREDELLKKMVDSQEHADLVKARQEVITIKKELAEQTEELQDLRASKEDSRNIIEALNLSINQKNIALTKLQIDLKELQQKQQEKPLFRKTSKHKKYKGTFMDKVFKAFSDILE